MSFRTFFLGLSASFGVAWLAVVIVPYVKMRSLEPMIMEEAEGTNAVFIPKRAGRITEGAQVYSENGCYQCHTQLIRPTYAGNDMFRADWGGLEAIDDMPDSRRETNAFDYAGERFAPIGISRLGPDLSNLGRRVEALYAPNEGISAEQWLYRHLYNPRLKAQKRDSMCPSFRFLFDEEKITGNPSQNAVLISDNEETEFIPGSDGRALVSYLLSLKKDHAVPASLDFSPQAAADLIPGQSPSVKEEAPAAENASDEANAPASEEPAP